MPRRPHATFAGPLAGAIALLCLLDAPADARQTAVPDAAAGSAPPYRAVMEAEARSRTLCESLQNRVFVTHKLGTECIAYTASRGHALQRRAVIFLDGDIPREKMAAETQALFIEAHQRSMQKMAERYGLPFIAISRPGVLGSSGHHGWRRRPAEALTINAAIDAIKARHGIDFIVLAGQSGGSTIAASLLTLGRRDISCAVLGSGNLAVVDLYMQRQNPTGRLSRDVVARSFYDPAQHITSIVRDPARRILIIGDPEDTRTPFPQQQRFAERLTAAGHHAHMIAIAGSGPDNHGASYAALPAAGLCALAVSDSGIGSVVATHSQSVAAIRRAQQKSAASPAASASR